MREILFRGKAIDDNWYYGVPLVFTEDYVCMTAPHTYNKKVEANTVGQYTGLTDKNGKKIFDGDIVRHYTHVLVGEPEKYEVGLIRWNERFLAWERTTPDKSEPLIGYVRISHNCVYEVIGNIHDNPELLLGGDRK